MKVFDLCDKQIVTVQIDDTLADAMARMDLHGGVRCLPVYHGGTVVGIIAESDFIRAMADGADPATTGVSRYMSADPAWISPEADEFDAAAMMAKLSVNHLPVMDQGTLIGVLSAHDLVQLLRVA